MCRNLCSVWYHALPIWFAPWIWAVFVMLITLSSHKIARAKVNPTVAVMPGLGVSIYKSDQDLFCTSCFQFNKPGPSLRVNILIDLTKGEFGLRVGVIAFGQIAFQSWNDHNIDLSSSRVAGVFTAGMTYKAKEKFIQIAAGVSIGGQYSSNEVKTDTGKTSLSTALYGGYFGVRFSILKPLIIDIEPLSFFVFKFEEQENYGQKMRLKLNLEVFWTPGVLIGYQW